MDIDLSDSYIAGKRDVVMEQIQNLPMKAIFRIILNHWPILTRTIRFVKPFINEIEPNLILKGDSHHVCKGFLLFEFEEIIFLVFYHFI